jgi:hypothetical protein
MTVSFYLLERLILVQWLSAGLARFREAPVRYGRKISHHGFCQVLYPVWNCPLDQKCLSTGERQCTTLVQAGKFAGVTYMLQIPFSILKK